MFAIRPAPQDGRHRITRRRFHHIDVFDKLHIAVCDRGNDGIGCVHCTIAYRHTPPIGQAILNLRGKTKKIIQRLRQCLVTLVIRFHSTLDNAHLGCRMGLVRDTSYQPIKKNTEDKEDNAQEKATHHAGSPFTVYVIADAMFTAVQMRPKRRSLPFQSEYIVFPLFHNRYGVCDVQPASETLRSKCHVSEMPADAFFKSRIRERPLG